jgi:hypothetical protein
MLAATITTTNGLQTKVFFGNSAPTGNLHILAVHGDEDKFMEHTLDLEAEKIIAVQKRGVDTLLDYFHLDSAGLKPKKCPAARELHLATVKGMYI